MNRSSKRKLQSQSSASSFASVSSSSLPFAPSASATAATTATTATTRSSSSPEREYNLDPVVDFNPSLYPKRRRTTECDTSSFSSTSDIHRNSYYHIHSHHNTNSYTNTYINSYNNNNNNNIMSRRKSWVRSVSSNSVNIKSIEKMFDEISEEDDPNTLTMEGICTIAEHLDINPLEDIRILVLLFKLSGSAKQFEKPGQLSREEWKKGCMELQTDSYDKFRSLLPSLDVGFMVDSDFRDFYKFCFQFNRQGTHKTLEKDLVIDLIAMVLKDRITQDRLSSFQTFLNQTTDTSYQRITLDQWMSFYDFSKACPDLHLYDEESSAWPVLIDDFVDFATSMQE